MKLMPYFILSCPFLDGFVYSVVSTTWGKMLDISSIPLTVTTKLFGLAFSFFGLMLCKNSWCNVNVERFLVDVCCTSHKVLNVGFCSQLWQRRTKRCWEVNWDAMLSYLPWYCGICLVFCGAFISFCWVILRAYLFLFVVLITFIWIETLLFLVVV